MHLPVAVSSNGALSLEAILMLKIKLFTCLLLACGATNAGVYLNWTVGVGSNTPMPIGRQDVLTNVPTGWRDCLVTHQLWKSDAGPMVVANIECHTIQGLKVQTGCTANAEYQNNNSALSLLGSDQSSQSFILACNYP